MTLTIRPNYGQDGSLPYAPQRDLRYIYPGILQAVCDRFNGGGWPALSNYAESRGCTGEDLIQAHLAFVSFVNNSCDNPEENMEQVLHSADWFNTPVEAQVAYMAMLGTVLAGQLFYALRDTTKLGDKPDGAEDLMKQALDIVVKYGAKPEPAKYEQNPVFSEPDVQAQSCGTGCCRRPE